MKQTCELCSMDGNYTKMDEQGIVHYFCHHHAPSGSMKSGDMVSVGNFKFSTYIPLIVIFSVIIIITTLASFLKESFSLDFTMRIFMGTFFAVFGLFKIINLRAFAEAYSTYDVLAMRSRVYAFTYPFIELTFALLYILNIGDIYRDIATIIIMVISSYGVFIKLRQKEEIPCACLGMVFKIPMTWVTLIEDIVMALMAALMIFM